MELEVKEYTAHRIDQTIERRLLGHLSLGTLGQGISPVVPEIQTCPSR